MARSVLLVRTPTTSASTSLVRQHAYGTVDTGWTLIRQQLLDTAVARGLALVRELLEGWSVDTAGAPGPTEHRGLLFRGRC